MPHSLIINFTPLSPISPIYLKGRHIHALFLTLVSHVDQQLGNSLHHSQSDKAFSLSPLQITRKNGNHNNLKWTHDKSISPGASCWFRVSLLDDTLFGQLTQLWLNLNPYQPWHLGSADLQITSILGTPQSTQPWANACPYQQLYEQGSETERTFKFIFATPTAFRQGKYDTPFPTPESVFKSLLNRWNKYSSTKITDLKIDSLFPSYFDIKTEIFTDYRSKFIGCIGNVQYRLLGEVACLQIKHFNVLADYALYCGVGRKTTMGMGMTRRLIN
ncbi:CRISPR-associated endoribonuclease Cas6 [Crocosphaera sp.]|uniref:CRISPR-associated endoribonuclease Cas6 n=1 Tax=Crocosphaera sp. TaxID=2729996 RepID=UPI00260E1FD4|nr:CRISPR-associated endoribonuclease Cas6 [Crocosphaera sp.]MDJ0581168.1 CRISPR-associated endoribonuclease Cas6 [Crocosphaera sp.]